MNTQTQTTSATILAFIAGFLASKFTFFDTSTWLAIVTAAAGLGGVIWTAVATRKTSLINNVAAMPEVKTVELDKTIPGTQALNNSTLDNVILK